MLIECVCVARHKYSYIGTFRLCSFGSAFAVLNYLQITPQTRPSRPGQPLPWPLLFNHMQPSVQLIRK